MVNFELYFEYRFLFHEIIKCNEILKILNAYNYYTFLKEIFKENFNWMKLKVEKS